MGAANTRLSALLKLRRRLTSDAAKWNGDGTDTAMLISGDVPPWAELEAYVDDWLEDKALTVKPDHHTVASVYRLAAKRRAFARCIPWMKKDEVSFLNGDPFAKLVQEHQWDILKQLLRESDQYLAPHLHNKSSVSQLVLLGLDSIVSDLLTRATVRRLKPSMKTRAGCAKGGEV